jgi:hypothetical protein
MDKIRLIGRQAFRVVGWSVGLPFHLAVRDPKNPVVLYVWDGGTYVCICHQIESRGTDFLEADGFSGNLWGNGVFESNYEYKQRLEKETPHVLAAIAARMEGEDL